MGYRKIVPAFDMVNKKIVYLELPQSMYAKIRDQLKEISWTVSTTDGQYSNTITELGFESIEEMNTAKDYVKKEYKRLIEDIKRLIAEHKKNKSVKIRML